MNELNITEVCRSFHIALPESLIRRVKAVAALEERDVADVTAVALSLYLAGRLNDNDPKTT
jgi:hypothetical protein